MELKVAICMVTRQKQQLQLLLAHVPSEEHLLKPSSVMTAVSMKTKGRRKARMRTVWKTVR